MKHRWYAFLFLAALAGLSGQRAEAMRTPLVDVRAAITQPHQLTAVTATSDVPADVPNQVRDASTWIVESIIPLGTTADGQPLALISLLVPLSSLDELAPASTRAGPYAAPKTHTRVFCIVQPPLGLAFGDWWDYRTHWFIAGGFFGGMGDGAVVLGDYATFGLTPLREKSLQLQDEARRHGDVLSQIGFGESDGDRHLMGDVAKLCVWWNIEVMTRALLGWGGQSVMRVNGFWRIRFFDLTGYRHSGARPAGGFGRCDDLVDEWALANADWR